MNKLIEEIFANFKVEDVEIPVSFMKHKGKETTYITYQNISTDGSLAGDDEILGYVEYYDFDVYSKSNYLKIVKEVKKILKQNGFMWQPSMSSEDYEEDTGYYHKTLCFAIEKIESEE